MADDLPRVRFDDADAFARWIAADGADAGGAWLVFAKKGAGVVTVTRQEAVDVALCHGGIDGQLQRVDERFYSIRFTPRRATSVWSAINTERVAELIAEGRMTPAGMVEVERAKADGRWDAAYAPPRRMRTSPALQAALDANPAAAATFAGLSAAERYSMNHRLHHLKTDAGRAKRVAAYVETLARGESPHPSR